jgi:hypothetical protein
VYLIFLYGFAMWKSLQAVEQACQIYFNALCTSGSQLHSTRKFKPLIFRPWRSDALVLRILWGPKCDIYDFILYCSGLILHALCRHILAPPLTEPVKLFIVPALAELASFPFRELLETLKSKGHSVPASTWLLFAVLSLEQRHFGKKCYLGFGET